MTLPKIGSIAIRLANKNALLQRLAIVQMRPHSRCESSRSTSKSDKYDEDLDKPIKFSSSQAASWKAEYSRTGRPIKDIPWFQPYIVMASTAIFLIYFCILREENDVDKKLTLSLSDHFQGEKKEALEATFKLPEEYAKNKQAIKTIEQ